MNELSVTVTAGEGSEKHNHDLEYRETLEHVHGREDGVIELMPYLPYKEQINAAMKPYIDEYNEKQQKRYQAAWERYNSGQISTKPRKRNYQPMGYDYYSDHLEDKIRNPRTGKVEDLPMWRELIIGIGDMKDRQEGKVSEDQAKAVMKKLVKSFKEDFPEFLMLGASLHLDEQGFYHMHLDYKPLYKKSEPEEGHDFHGLSVGVGQDAALDSMGFQPEQSIINGRDKVPILFNAMRNKIYYRMEEAMATEGLRLQYGVSRVKEPSKDSSVKQDLDDWAYTQDAARELQHRKNLTLELLESKEWMPDELQTIYASAEKVYEIIDQVEKSPRSRLNKDSIVVNFNLFSQLRSFVERMMNFVAAIINDRNYWRDAYYDLEKKQNSLDNKTKAAEQRSGTFRKSFEKDRNR